MAESGSGRVLVLVVMVVVVVVKGSISGSVGRGGGGGGYIYIYIYTPPNAHSLAKEIVKKIVLRRLKPMCLRHSTHHQTLIRLQKKSKKNSITTA